MTPARYSVKHKGPITAPSGVGATTFRPLTPGASELRSRKLNHFVPLEPTLSTQSVTPSSLSFEHFVDADHAAEFLGMERRLLLDWARRGSIPGHPWGEGKRRVWRFLLSELAQWGTRQQNEPSLGAAKNARKQ